MAATATTNYIILDRHVLLSFCLLFSPVPLFPHPIFPRNQTFIWFPGYINYYKILSCQLHYDSLLTRQSNVTASSKLQAKDIPQKQVLLSILLCFLPPQIYTKNINCIAPECPYHSPLNMRTCFDNTKHFILSLA